MGLDILFLFKKVFFKYIIYLFGEKEGRKKEEEKHPCERETPISSFSHAPQPGTGPPAQPCALTGNGTRDPLLCGMIPDQFSHTSLGAILFLNVLVHAYV